MAFTSRGRSPSDERGRRCGEGAIAVADVFWAFLQLGLTSFGGPTAHLGYFRRAFVERRAWLGEAEFASIVAFCSVLPGPTSSQVGMLIGLSRAGPGGACAAWLAFTAPSAIAMTFVALALDALERHAGSAHSRWFDGLIVGLTAAAAAVVAQAVMALARTLCTDAVTRAIAAGATLVALATAAYAGLGWLPIALGAGAGLIFARTSEIAAGPLPIRVSRRVAALSAVLFAAICVACAIPAAVLTPAFVLLATIARAGALVFGGGHVVLPLLHGLAAQGLISEHAFFAGYGAVQAMPGPLFTFAAFLGAANSSPLHGVPGAAAAAIAIFAPSFALIFALAPVWNRVRTIPGAAAALRGANAAVVGLLAAVLIRPMLASLTGSIAGIVIAIIAYAVMARWKVVPWVVVVASAGAGALAGALG
jgi:chromate transporter